MLNQVNSFLSSAPSPIEHYGSATTSNLNHLDFIETEKLQNKVLKI